MSDPEPLIGRVLDGKYRIESCLGTGGMGSVLLATHLGTERRVALKVILDRLAQDDEFVERFQREARAAGRLRHPIVVDITDFGTTQVDGARVVYLVMEFLEGASLARVLEQEGRLSLEQVVELTGQLCSALQVAHEKGILHRDLKPENLWLVPDERGGSWLKILDFGLARIYDPLERMQQEKARGTRVDVAGGPPGPTVLPAAPGTMTGGGREGAGLSANLTEVGTVLGTPAYMSPEQCRGEQDLDARSDLYSVGVILFQMLGGELPFRGDSLALLHQHLSVAPPELRKLRPDVGKRVATLVGDCLSKAPGGRPESAAHLAARLEAATVTQPILMSRALRGYAQNLALDLWLGARCHGPFLLACVGALLMFKAGGGASYLVHVLIIVSVAWLVGTILLLGTYRGMAFSAFRVLLQWGLPERRTGIAEFHAKGELKRALDRVGRKFLRMFLLMGWPAPLMFLAALPPFSTNRSAREAALLVIMLVVDGWMLFYAWRLRREPLGADPLRFLCEEILDPEEITRLDRHVRSRHKGMWRQYRRHTYVSWVLLSVVLSGFAMLGWYWVLPFARASHPWSSFPGLQVLTCATAFLLLMPFLTDLGAEAALVEWREAGLDMKGIVTRIRQRFFPGRTWFERQGSEAPVPGRGLEA